MFDFLTGFLLGIVFTVGVMVFGIYKLLLRQGGDRSSRQLPSYPSLTQLQHTKHVKHSIPKYTIDETEMFETTRNYGYFANTDQNIESCAWLNTIAANLCVEALKSPALVESLHKNLHDILNKPEDKPDILGKIVVSDINMGTGLPQISGIRVLSRAHDDALHADVSLHYDGGASFTISTELWVNWPSPKFASLPVSLHASFDSFDGTLTASCHFPSSNKTRVTLYFLTPPKLQLRIGSTIGHTTKLVNVLQISNLLENMIYSFVNKELVAPNGFEVELEDGKVSVVRKLTSIPTPSAMAAITEKGEKADKGERDGKSGLSGGDLSRRSFSVSASASG